MYFSSIIQSQRLNTMIVWFIPWGTWAHFHFNTTLKMPWSTNMNSENVFSNVPMYAFSTVVWMLCPLYYQVVDDITMVNVTSWSTRTTRTLAFWGYPRRLMITHTIESCWIPSQSKVEWPWRYKSRSSVITCNSHLLMLVIICIKYGNNPSRTIDATEPTRFSRLRPNDLENIGQGQRSLHATHPLMLMMICAKYGKNTSRIVFFSRWKPKN